LEAMIAGLRRSSNLAHPKPIPSCFSDGKFIVSHSHTTHLQRGAAAGGRGSNPLATLPHYESRRRPIALHSRRVGSEAALQLVEGRRPSNGSTIMIVRQELETISTSFAAARAWRIEYAVRQPCKIPLNGSYRALGPFYGTLGWKCLDTVVVRSY